jgi:hypothetical protein
MRINQKTHSAIRGGDANLLALVSQNISDLEVLDGGIAAEGLAHGRAHLGNGKAGQAIELHAQNTTDLNQARRVSFVKSSASFHAPVKADREETDTGAKKK